jgi:hypothetical protein
MSTHRTDGRRGPSPRSGQETQRRTGQAGAASSRLTLLYRGGCARSARRRPCQFIPVPHALLRLPRGTSQPAMRTAPCGTLRAGPKRCRPPRPSARRTRRGPCGGTRPRGAVGIRGSSRCMGSHQFPDERRSIAPLFRFGPLPMNRSWKTPACDRRKGPFGPKGNLLASGAYLSRSRRSFLLKEDIACARHADINGAESNSAPCLRRANGSGGVLPGRSEAGAAGLRGLMSQGAGGVCAPACRLPYAPPVHHPCFDCPATGGTCRQGPPTARAS